MTQQTKSAVQLYWEAICAKAGVDRSWDSLHPQEVQQIIMSINLLLGVLGND